MVKESVFFCFLDFLRFAHLFFIFYFHFAFFATIFRIVRTLIVGIFTCFLSHFFGLKNYNSQVLKKVNSEILFSVI